MRRKTPSLIEGAEHWKCSRCGEWLSADRYYADKRTPNDLKAQCRSCHSEGAIRTRDRDKHCDIRRVSMRRARLRDPEKYRRRGREASRKREWTPKREARYQLNLAVKRGDVTRPDKCSECGKRVNVEGHHDDHSRPFDVRWLCPECHGLKHRHTFEKVER